MGAEQSAEVREVAPEEISRELTEKFAVRCYTQLEIYCFKEVFKSLCDVESGLEYWSEASLCRFLELPDTLNVGPVLYQMTTFLGAFPFPSQAPCIVTKEALLKVVTLMTERYNKVLKRGGSDRLRLFYSSLAVFDRRASELLDADAKAAAKESLAADPLAETIKGMEGFAIDEPANDEYEEDEDDELALALLDTLDASQIIGLADAPNVRHSIIPSDNFLKLIQLLLVIAPLDSQQSLSSFADRVSDEHIGELRTVASHILATFGVDGVPGITYRNFRAVVTNSLPFMFEGLGPLFEHFLFERSFDLSKRRHSITSQTSPESTGPVSPKSPKSPTSPTSPKSPTIPFPGLSAPSDHYDDPLLPSGGDLLTPVTLSQLAFILPPSSLFHRLHTLYSGATSGFSMGSFEAAVFPWSGPTLLLISGTLLPPVPSNSRERSFADSLPPKRHPDSTSFTGTKGAKQVTYGAYIPVPWKATHREPFGTADTLLFQLAPAHDVFRASHVSKDYATFVHSGISAQHPGIGFGSALPLPGRGAGALLELGPVSLFMDAALEYAVFTHTAAADGPSGHGRMRAYSTARDGGLAGGSSSGGSFHASSAPARGKKSWQDRFEIEALEVYGVGGAEIEAKRQRALEFEEREARLRREGRSSVSGGTGGHEADRELLKMAGLIGHGELGGSMG